MSSLRNRIRTITGRDVNWFVAFGRMVFYAFRPGRWGNIIEKLSGKNSYEKYYLEQQQEFDLISLRKLTGEDSNLPEISILITGDEPDKIKITLASLNEQIYRKVKLYTLNETAAAQFELQHAGGVQQFLSLVPGNGFFIIVDEGTVVHKYCLATVIKILSGNRDVKIIYADEDHLNENGERVQPILKPGWSPQRYSYQNYTGPVFYHGSLAKSLLERMEFTNQAKLMIPDADVLKRGEVIHIPKVLFSNSKNKLLPVDNKGTLYSGPDLMISIIIPTRNQAELLKTCIGSVIEKSTWRNFEIVLVDNNSDDPVLENYILELENIQGLKFRAIKYDREFNFSSLVNAGAANSSGEYLLLLNNDMEVITPQWMENMLYFAVMPNVGAVGAKLVYPDDTIQHAGIMLDEKRISTHVFKGAARDEEVALNSLNVPCNYLAVTAACLMVSKKRFDSIGGFDESFRVEYNDVDFCLKLYDKGYDNVFTPGAVLYHYESASRRHPHSDKKSYRLHLEESSRMRDRWSNYIQADPYRIPEFN